MNENEKVSFGKYIGNEYRKEKRKSALRETAKAIEVPFHNS